VNQADSQEQFAPVFFQIQRQVQFFEQWLVAGFRLLQ